MKKLLSFLSFLILFTNSHCSGEDRAQALTRIYTAGRYWNDKYLENELKKIKYLTPIEKRTAIKSCDDYTDRFGWNTQISQPSDICHFMTFGLLGTFLGLCLFGSCSTYSDPALKTAAITLTTAPLWIGAYGISAMKWDEKITNNWKYRRDLINKLPDYESQN